MEDKLTTEPIMKKIPIILIPGIMGTSIIRNTDNKELWPSILSSNIIALALDPNGNDILIKQQAQEEYLDRF